MNDDLKLYLGDCLEILKDLPSESVDAVITDPPYGTTGLIWDKPVDLASWWEQIRRICKPTSMVVVFGAQPFTTDLINSNRREFRYELVWCKTRGVGFLDANKRPLRAHEDILVFSRRWRGPKNLKICTYNPQYLVGRPYKKSRGKGESQSGHYGTYRTIDIQNDGRRHPLSWQLFSSAGRGSLHPTQKPLGLVRWLVLSYLNPGDLVLDPFMGSGTTGVACKLTGRRFIGIEMDPNYLEVARKRIDSAFEEAVQFSAN